MYRKPKPMWLQQIHVTIVCTIVILATIAVPILQFVGEK